MPVVATALALVTGATVAVGGADPRRAEPVTDLQRVTAKPDRSHARVLGEVAERRRATSRTFRLADGTLRTELYTEPVNYRDERGTWRKVDSTLVPTGAGTSAYRNRAGSFDARLPRQLASGWVRIEEDGHAIGFRLQGARATEGRVSGNVVTYERVLPGVTVRHGATGAGLKEELILANADAPGSFRFDLDLRGGRIERVAGGGFVIRDDAGRRAFAIPSAYMTDAAGASRKVPMRVERGTLVVDPSDRWLRSPTRRFPVVVDPSVVTGPVTDCYIDSAAATTSFCGGTALEVGKTSTARKHALLKFNLGTAVPATAKLLSAQLSLRLASKTTETAKQVGLYRAGKPWSSTTTWTSASSGVPWAAPGGDVAGSRLGSDTWNPGDGTYWWADLNATDAVKGWLTGATANDGFVLKDENPAAVNVLRFNASEYGTTSTVPADRPRLLIDWTERLGHESQYTYVTERSGARIEASVNVGNGNLFATVNALRRPGTTVELDVSHHYNSLSGTWQENFGWPLTMTTSAGVRVFRDGTGAAFSLVRDDVAGTWRRDEGLAADFVAGDLRFDTGLVYGFMSGTGATGGQLVSKSTAAGTGVTYDYRWLDLASDYIFDGISHSGTGRYIPTSGAYGAGYAGLTDPAGRKYEWSWNGRTLLEQLLPGGARDVLTYGAPNSRLTRLAPADGAPIKVTYDTQNRVTSMTRVTDVAADTGPTTTFAYAAPSTPCDPAKYVGKTTVTAPDGEQTVYCYDASLRGDKMAPDAALADDLAQAAQEPETPVSASAYELDVAATDQGTRQRGLKRIEVFVDGEKVHDTGVHPCDAGGCPLDTSVLLRPQWFAPGNRKVEVVSTDQVNNKRRDERTVKVPSEPSNTAGLESWYQYDTVETGAGTQAHVNLSTGNLVWHGVPLVNLGRGLSTYVNLSYNSADKGGQGQHEGGLNNEADGPNYNQAGQNFSLGISGMTRLNEPLVVSSSTGGVVTMYDADGTRHRFKKSADGVTFEPPPGVNLHLRKFSNTNFSKSWAITRPDGATYFFDRLGYQTSIEDRNGNVIRFEYEPLPKASPAACTSEKWASDLNCKKRVVRVTDSAGVVDMPAAPNRSVQVRYYPETVPASDGNAAGRIKEIVDHAGRVTAFYYDDRAFLRRVVQAQGTTDERRFLLTYEGSGQDMNLAAIEDPRGNTTRIEYEQRGGPMRRVAKVTNRRGKPHSYAYDTRVERGAHFEIATVTDARNQRTVHTMDGLHRPIEIVDPLGTRTTLGWDADNNVVRHTRAAGTPDESTDTMAYNANGLLTRLTDGNLHPTELTYRDGPGLHLTALGTDAGKGFVSDLLSIRRPEGNTTRFEPDAAGNVRKRIDGENHEATTDYGPRGQITAERDEVGNLTTYHEHDPNGLPRLMIDARGNETGADPSKHRWIYKYDVLGNLLAATDPRGAETGGVDDPRTAFTATLTYDAFDRVRTLREPKRSELGQYVERSFRYDPNGNLDQQTDGNQAVWSYAYTPMDLVEEVRSPAVPHHGRAGDEPEVTRTRYDDEDAIVEEVAPNAVTTTVAGAYTTRYVRDAIGRAVAEFRQSRETGKSVDLVTSYAYDRRDNVIAMVDPRRNAAGGDPVANAGVPAKRRATYAYDKADNLRGVVEDPTGEALETSYSYDANDNLVAEVDPRGTVTPDPLDFTTSYGYDNRDLLVSTTDGMGRRTALGLRGDGRVSTITTPRGTASAAAGDFEVHLSYYATGELKDRTLPFAENQYGSRALKLSYGINQVGDPTTITDPRGKQITNTFLDSGELLTTTRPSWWAVDGTGVRERSLEEMAGMPDRQRRPASAGQGDFGSVGPQGAASPLPAAGTTTFGYDDEFRLRSITDAAGKAVEIDRDALGRTLEVRRPLDAVRQVVERYAYDFNGNLRQTIDPEQHETTLGYDQFDRVVSQTRPGATNGAETTRLTLDANGNAFEVETPRATKWQLTYDPLDRLTGERNPLSELTTYGYDRAGNRTSVTTPRGNDLPEAERAPYRTRLEFNAANELVKRIDGLGNEWRYDYDANGNQIKVDAPPIARNPDAAEHRQVTTRTYDGRDLLWTETKGADDNGEDRTRTRVFEFDPNGKLRRIVNPKGVDATTGLPSFSYTADGDVSTNADAAKHATVYEYGASDPSLTTRIRLPWGDRDAEDQKRYQQTYGHDARGRVNRIDAPHETSADPAAATDYTHYETGWIRSADDRWQEFTYDYDRRGLQTSWKVRDKTSGDVREMERVYWPSGALRSRSGHKTRQGTRETKYTYRYDYHRNGLLAKFADDRLNRETSFSYDDADRQTVADEAAFRVEEQLRRGKDTKLVYDRDGNITKRLTDGRIQADGSYAGGKTATFDIDPLGREKSMTVTAAGEATRTTYTDYWPAGQRRSRRTERASSANDTIERWFRFSDGRLSRVDRKRQGSVDFAKNQTYDYDANGNRTRDERGTHEYNSRDQLVRWTKENGTDTVSYTLNASGGLKTKTEGGSTTSYVYHPGNERLKELHVNGTPVARYEYDTGFGDVTRIVAAGSGTTISEFVYDDFGRKTRTKTPSEDEQYTYDGLDRRDTKTSGGVTFDFSYVSLSEALSQEEQLGGEERRSYDYNSLLERMGVARRDTAAETAQYRAYSKDANNSVEGLQDANGEVQECPPGSDPSCRSDAYSYDPYGQALDAEGNPLEDESGLSSDAAANPFRFEGHYYEAASETYDMRARSYMPSIGRFLQEDHYEDALGDHALEADPLTQDRYAFAGGNPINLIEFDGHEPPSSFTNGCDPIYGSDERCAEEGDAAQEASKTDQQTYTYAYSSNWKVGRATSAQSDKTFSKQYAEYHNWVGQEAERQAQAAAELERTGELPPGYMPGMGAAPPPFPRPYFDNQPNLSMPWWFEFGLSCVGAKAGCLKAGKSIIGKVDDLLKSGPKPKPPTTSRPPSSPRSGTPDGSNRFLRGTAGNAGPVPESVASKLRGRTFSSPKEFRETFWRTVADDPDLAGQFSASNVTRMRKGLAPRVVPSQRLGGQRSYILHHRTPVSRGGARYDPDNILVVTPRYHKEVLEPSYHYGAGR